MRKDPIKNLGCDEIYFETIDRTTLTLAQVRT
jgi:hypothetical protein